MRIARALCLVAAVVSVSVLGWGCGAAPGDVSVWIDAPLSGGRVNQGEEVLVQTHAYSSGGVAEIELVVDGEPFSRDAPSPAGGDLVTLNQTWIASAPGMHFLQVAAYDSSGAVSSPVAVSIEVLGQETATPQPAIETATETAVPTGTGTFIPPTDTPTSVAAPVVNFNADDESVAAGECTYLRWAVQNADTVTLDGSAVGNTDARQVCPQQTTDYTLRAVSAGGDRAESVRIEVSAPAVQDTAGPVISNLGASPGKIFDNGSCGADRAQIVASVHDAGSGVKRVDIYYRVVKPPTQGKSVAYGSWVSLKMMGDESQGYYNYLGSAELTRSLNLYGGGSVEYYLVATDGSGNSTQSGTNSFQTETCLF